MSEDRKRCFVIMPFSQTAAEHTEEYWTKHFKFFLKPLIKDCSLEAHRSKPLRGSIVKQIITDLVMSSVVVADLTDANPNIYWELGVRQSFRHRTILIAQNGTELPFDIKDTGTLFYDPDHLDVDDFRNNFKAAIADCLENSNRMDSYVLEAFSRGSLYEIIRREEILHWLDAVLSECGDNQDVLETVVKQVERNQDDPENRVFIGDRCRPWAAELLVTNRYVDEGQLFYQIAELYLDSLTEMNAQLGLWVHQIQLAEEWLLKYEEMTTYIFEIFKDEVETVRVQIERKQY
ncbi:MAG: hypothetical protein KAU52_02895 [Methanosarcinales archaeon]|nr:hypothetical protein [Methanosarcinales archaeon]